MRAGPLGAYFADDLPRVVTQAELASRTTHTHPEAVAGAIAVAVAAAIACQDSGPVSPAAWLKSVLTWVPSSEVRSRLERASALPEQMHTDTAAAILGNGSQLSAQDTVPFALWCAARHLGDFEEAMWAGVMAGGDRDTICAIVGSVVAMTADVPVRWLEAREALPQWFSMT